MATKTIYLVDGSSFAYRAFYAIGQLSTSKGQPTNAVYGFTRMLIKLVDRYKPEYLLIAFDTGRPTFRHAQYKEYKAHRKPMPEEMISQIPWIKRIVSAYNIPIIEKEGYEADDIIATMAFKAVDAGFSVYIVTGDKDMMQLVSSMVKIIVPAKEDLIYDAERIKERFGVPPDRIIHLLALTGDSSDNIPGVPGIGEKTAARLIQKFGDIDGIFRNLQDIPPRLRDAIVRHMEEIKNNLDLIKVKKDLDLELKPEDCLLKEANKDVLKELFRELEFKILLKELLEKDSPKPNDEYSGAIQDLEGVKSISITEEGVAYEKDGKVRFLNIELYKIKKLLEDPNIKKYAYDIKSILRNGLVIKGNFFDTHIAQALLGEKVDNYHPIEIYKAVPELEKRLIDEGLFDLYNRIELPLIEVLASMEGCGIKLDIHVLKELSKELERDLLHLTEKIYNLAGEAFNINSPKQLENILFEKLKLPKGRRTKTGFSTNVDVLEALTKYHELPRYILEYRQLMKLKGTYVDPLPQMVDPRTSRLHTTFDQVGAITGRLSSSNPNLQNIPIKTGLGKRIRSAFIPGGADLVLLGADYSQIELRVLAHLSGDRALIEAFLEDKDIHTQTAQEIFGVSEITSELRRQAKIVNFGIIYGMGAKAMAENLGLSLQDAQGFIDRYLERYPGVGEYIRDQLNEAKEHGYVITMFGRKRKVPELFSSKPQEEAFGRRIAINTPIQGSSADIIKMAMINIYKGIKEKGLQANMLLQIHDELIFEVREDCIDEVSKYIKDQMENVIKLKVPLKVDIKVGRSWADL